MTDVAAVDATRTARAAAQLLAPPREPARPVDIVRHLIGIQAQLPSAAALAIRARTTGITAADVAAAQAAGDLVRTWVFRGTLHVVAAEDLDWLLGLVRQTIIARSARRRGELGLDDETVLRSSAVLGEALEDWKPRSRAELFAALEAAGVDAGGQRGIHLIRHAALTGRLCFGPDRGHEPTWIAREPRVERRTRTKALAELARRYREAYGPTDARDLAAWAGLPAVDARQAWSTLGTIGEPRVPMRSAVRLLPHFDPYLLGYRTRELIVPSQYAHAVWTGGGYVMPTVVADGQAVGTWEAVRRSGSMNITVRPFGSLADDTRSGINAEVADIGRFLGVQSAWTIGAAASRA
ncbi:MAG TPA: winged helix DNA-binding domain-containing protein [Jiangellaceae bacterium]